MADSKEMKSQKSHGNGRQLEDNGQNANFVQSQSSLKESHSRNGAMLGVGNSPNDTANGLSSSQGNHEGGSRGSRRAMGSRGRGSYRGNQGSYLSSATSKTSLLFRNGLGNSASTTLSPNQVQDVLEASLSEINSSDSLAITVVDDWATEAGLACIRQIVETDFAQYYSVTRLMFEPHCILFLRLLSYVSREDIQNSLVLEKSVGTIHNVVYGPNGNRGVTFFRRVVGCLKNLKNEKGNAASDNESQDREVLLHITEAILSILLQVQEAAFKSEFKEVTETIWSFFVNDTDHPQESLITHLARENLLKAQDIFGTEDGITASKQKLRGNNKKRTQPAVAVDFPGELSSSGKRHDNDHAAISNIKILPTLSEILYSRRVDFLPTRDALHSRDQHHEQGIRRLLDSHFRLLREDTSGVLRDSVRVILENWETLVHGTKWQEKRKLLRSHCPSPARIYYGAQIQKLRSDRVKGMEIDVEFDQVPRARNMGIWKRKNHWRTTRGLNEGGALLALIDAEAKDDISVIFFQVSQRKLDPVIDEDQADTIRDLVSSGKRAMITLRLTNPPSDDGLDGIIHLVNKKVVSSTKPLILVEFPALLYNAFEGILRSLQTLYRDPRYLPFTEWIAPQDRYPRAYTMLNGYKAFAVCQPAYRKDWEFDFSPISTSEGDKGATPLRFQSGEDSNLICEQLFERTTLDMGQARAMVSAFKNRLALIQGPPGTGKSYVGIQIAKCLVAQNSWQGLGPILCVCYTNHALDQFLQGLYDSGISNIVRIGSHSSSPLLESLSLDTYKKQQRIPRIPGHGRYINEQRQHLEVLALKIREVCERLQSGTEGLVKAYLQRRFPKQDKEIMQGLLVKTPKPLGTWVLGNGPGDLIGNGDERTIEQLLGVNKWTLKNEERNHLLEHWHKSALQELSVELKTATQQHAAEKRYYTSLFNMADSQIFNEVDVVGITTTGLANNAELLQSLNAKVLICEEAGEVLESHVLTTLLPTIEHAILIGDHLQLRPKISTKRLSAEYDSDGPKYNLDESLFERLANFSIPSHRTSSEEDENADGPIRFPVEQLNNQRRMHPSIASLVRGTLYPNLCDHPRTHSYDEVSGFKNRLFWLDHRNIEDPDDPEDPMRSKTNKWEAEMVVSMVKHLCKQEQYKPGDIAILTPYIGQLRHLRDQLDGIVDLVIADQDLADLDESEQDDDNEEANGTKNNKNQKTVEKARLSDRVRIATVDNFQGDEATVVIVSLVRSNKYRNCGFLKTSNRINVLLSRAKHGMYIVGNADTASSVPMWSSAIRMLEDGDNIGPKLPLYCSRHPKNLIHVSSPEDFLQQAPEGGCSEQCNRRLSCGHTCTFKCHTSLRHDAVKCMKPCAKMRECGHSCSLRCNEECGECVERITNAHLPCGHAMDIECRYRGRLASVKCAEIVTKTLPGCGHDINVKCHEDLSKKRCFHPCQKILGCGHTCRKPCWECWKPGDQDVQSHSASCTTVCGRPYSTCSHTCPRPCHPSTPCPPCEQPCQVRCRHNKCPKKCGEPCAPCAEKCGWTCSHRQNQVCNMPCAIPCDMIPCSKRCENLLSCGHRCPSVCGEQCPSQKFCQACGDAHIHERGADLLTFETYREIDLDQDPCVFLTCGHFYTVSSFDGIMNIKKYYNIDPATDNIISPKLTRRIMSRDEKTHGCPECRLPLRDIYRYNRIVKKALLDESTKRFIVTASSTYRELLGEVSKREMELEKARADSMGEYLIEIGEPRKPVVSRPRKKDKLQKRIDKFIKSMAAVEQPYGKVNDLLAAAATRDNTVSSSVFRADESKIQTGFEIRGHLLQVRLTWAILWDYRMISNDIRTDSKLSSELRDVVASQTIELLHYCISINEDSVKVRLVVPSVEAKIYYSLFASVHLTDPEINGRERSTENTQKLREDTCNTLEECEKLYFENFGTLGFLKGDIEKAKSLLNGATFYSFVSTEEKQQVYDAMATQFQGTGHWYYCRNNHPFTVGECGMPTEEARCPQCGEPVGGLNHQPSTGVTSAEDFEAQFGGR